MAKQAKKTDAKVWKALKSTDPRKKVALAKLKAVSDCRKVTQVEISSDGELYRGKCMNPNRGGEVGFHTAPVADRLDISKPVVINPEPAVLSPEMKERWSKMVESHSLASQAKARKSAPAKLVVEVTPSHDMSEDAILTRLDAIRKEEKNLGAALEKLRAKAATEASANETFETMQTLLAGGWRIVDVQRALKMPSPGPVHNWKTGEHGAGPERLVALKALLDKPAPALSGVIKAKATKASKAAKQLKAALPEDPRQLILFLRDALTAALK